MTGIRNDETSRPSIRTWAAVPFRGRTGKRRLAGILTDSERAALVDALLGDVLDALAAVPEIERVLVVAPAGTRLPVGYGERVVLLDEPSLSGGRPPRAPRERGPGGGEDPAQPGAQHALNAAVAHAQGAAEAAGVERLLVVPADLPLIGADDVHSLLRRSDRLVPAPHVVLAPDAAEEGTNALLLHAPTAIPPLFGRNSFARHRRVAREREIAAGVVRADTLALDLDTPADLTRLLAAKAGGRTLAFLQRLSPEERLGLAVAQR